MNKQEFITHLRSLGFRSTSKGDYILHLNTNNYLEVVLTSYDSSYMLLFYNEPPVDIEKCGVIVTCIGTGTDVVLIEKLVPILQSLNDEIYKELEDE